MKFQLALIEIGKIITTLWIVDTVNPEPTSFIVWILGFVACLVILVDSFLEKVK